MPRTELKLAQVKPEKLAEVEQILQQSTQSLCSEVKFLDSSELSELTGVARLLIGLSILHPQLYEDYIEFSSGGILVPTPDVDLNTKQMNLLIELGWIYIPDQGWSFDFD